MKLSVFVLGKDVASLESQGQFQCALTYNERALADEFVSLTMPVQRDPHIWDDELHPVFRMNLPEGYLLQVLQEEFGPQIGASPLDLLAVIGRNMIGRLQVATPGSNLEAPPQAIDVAALLQGDNSEEAFSELVRKHATSGVSGVVPKFLDGTADDRAIGGHKKSTLFSERHIIKGSSKLLPFVAINEHLCMEVARRVTPAATTSLSDDGQALVVDRFDLDENGQRHWGMEDFCALLGLRPSAKYETTWERIARAVRDHVQIDNRPGVFFQLGTQLLLTHALRNADCHAKNIALRYTSRRDVHLSPAYDMITTAAYADYQYNPPGISLAGRKTWDPGKSLSTFLTSVFGIPLRDQRQLIERIGDSMSEVGPMIRAEMEKHPGFQDVGKRMLQAWSEGISSLTHKKAYAMPAASLGDSFEGFSDAPRVKASRPARRGSGMLGPGTPS